MLFLPEYTNKNVSSFGEIYLKVNKEAYYPGETVINYFIYLL